MPPNLLTPIPPPAPLQETLKQWNSWGAVVDHFIFPVAGEINIAAHFQAACSGLFKGVHQWENRSRKGAIDWEQLTVDSNEAGAPQEFFGVEFNVQLRTLYLRGETYANRNSYFSPGERESEEIIRYGPPVIETFFGLWELGYAHALIDPPYPLTINSFFKSKRVSNGQLWSGFSRLCDELWGDLDSLQIYGWPTTCSNYFDAGNEWWGAGFWTVYSPTHHWIVTVLASTTD